MPIFKRCNLCGKRIPEGSKCSCVSRRHREYDRTRDKKLYDFYRGRDWQTIAELMRVRYQGLDVYELIMNNARISGEAVHHIYPVDEFWDKRFDTDFMIMLSESNHRIFHSMMKSGKKEEVIALLIRCVVEYRKRFGYE